MITLYNYPRSSAAFRVRIALNLKQLPYRLQDVHLINNGGEQNSAIYYAINPQKLIPTLVDDNFVLTQSLAILEYLEEHYPQIPLLPKNSTERALMRALAQIVCCDIHPLNNLRTVEYLRNNFRINEEQKQQWYAHWIIKGLSAYEELLSKHKCFGEFSVGNMFSIADCCLIPQIYNATRFAVDISEFNILKNINSRALHLPAVLQASPDRTC